MSDLQCPATLLIASSDADQTEYRALSDDAGSLTDEGRARVRHLVEQLRSRQIAEVCCSSTEPAVQLAELAASELGVKASITDGLQEPSSREGGDAVVSRFQGALQEIADTHRGERVLVFTHVEVMSLMFPRLAVEVCNAAAQQRFPPNYLAVEVDADGLRVMPWPDNGDSDLLHTLGR
jgi:broad specificity phosphatase PhoE